jgi:YfiR/HmsC-like
MRPLGRADNAEPFPRAGAADSASWISPCIPLLVVLLPLFSSGVAGTARAQSNDDEYRVKAAFLFHFAQLVDWPADSLKGADNSLLLCTLGADPFQGALESTVEGKAIGNRVIRIRHLKQAQDMQGCRILFLGKAQSKGLPTLLADLRNVPILTVGETPGFLAAGGMISFLLEENKVRFEINLNAAQSAGLKVGSRLLILAQNVVGESREQ